MPSWTEWCLIRREEAKCRGVTGCFTWCLERASGWLDNLQRRSAAGLVPGKTRRIQQGAQWLSWHFWASPWRYLSHKPTWGCGNTEIQLSQGWSEWAQVGHSSLNVPETSSHYSFLPPPAKGHTQRDWEGELKPEKQWNVETWGDRRLGGRIRIEGKN